MRFSKSGINGHSQPMMTSGKLLGTGLIALVSLLAGRKHGDGAL
jgi:hypothetical protein